MWTKKLKQFLKPEEITQESPKTKINEKMIIYIVHILKKKKMEIKILFGRPFYNFKITCCSSKPAPGCPLICWYNLYEMRIKPRDNKMGYTTLNIAFKILENLDWEEYGFQYKES